MFDSGCALGAKMCNNQCVPADPMNGCSGMGCAPCPAAPANSVVDCTAGACGFTCNAGFGDCNNNAADGCEQDVSMDPKNCGSCGFACPQGAMCVSGACQLVMPGPGSDQACLTIDANTIYWATANANPGAVYSVPKNGGNPTQIITGAKNPRGVAVDANNVYFTTTVGGEIMKCPLAGCGNNPTVLATGQTTPFGITVDANNVYWTNRVAAGTIQQCSINGCNMQPTTVASNQNSPWGIAVDGGNVYWTNSGDGTMASAPIGGGQVKVLAMTNAAGAHGIALDANAIYFAQSTQGTIVRVPRNGGMPTTINASKNPWSIAVDATDLFWSNSQAANMGGSIDKTPLGGGAVTQRAINQGFPLCIAIDATNVYWIDAGGNSVQKVAK
jgi:sugar lactone lactonase YvrE